MIGIDTNMPENCHECDACGISDIVGLCSISKEEYSFDGRPESCPLVMIGAPIKEEVKGRTKGIWMAPDPRSTAATFKCSICGGDVDDLQPTCPYCHTEIRYYKVMG